MPLSRLGVRNAYGMMSQTESYKKNVDREDPKAILNGVSVYGLVGILRQLGDLAEFAAEIFHGIQEEVMATASRSNKLKIRLQNIEATVPPLEKTVLAQTTHLHFAYTGGMEWHPRIRNEQNQFIYSDLPRLIMDPYEECRDPPRLHLLDKFDINGPGSCLKRYSNPTYFTSSSNNKFQNNNKNSKIKKRKSSSRSQDMSRLANENARKTFSFIGQTSSASSSSSSSSSSKNGPGYIECLLTATSSLKTGEKPKDVFASSSLTQGSCTIASILSECETEDSFRFSPLKGKTPCISWDEKTEIVEPSEMMETNSIVDEKGSNGEGSGQVDDKSESELEQNSGINGLETVGDLKDSSEDESESEDDCFVDALNTIESESENDQRLQTSQEEVSSSNERLENPVCEKEIGKKSNIVEDSCRSTDGLMDNGLVERLSSVNASDEMNNKNPRVSSDTTTCSPSNGGEDDIAFKFVPAPENSLSDSSNTLYHHSVLEEHQKPEAIKIWTNGSLLGLKPSKPPVLPVPTSSSPDCNNHERKVGVDIRDYNETSSRVFGLGNGGKTLPPTIPEKSIRFYGSNEETPIDWTTCSSSSPPLQHMKLSLNPVDTLQASMLKLNFSHGDNKSNNDTFSSFQLLPVSAATTTSLVDSYSDDDGTFCRSSSPYMSDTDYHLSDNHSLTDSEQWEEEEDDRKAHVDILNLSYLQNPAEPLPPPFPPAQWMVSKKASETPAKSLHLQDALKLSFEKHISSSTINKQLPNMVTSSDPKPEIKVHLKSNVKQIANEAVDFLQQIKTQQFNLRPVVMTTTTLSTSTTTDPTINVKISAILEKANSIRQALASNDGDESDTWSDT